VINVACDLHIHTALSPCALAEMTPRNIVNMARLAGAEVIAITDHNSCRNVAAVTKAAGDKLLIIPGLEVWTREDVHLLCLFPSLVSAEQFGAVVYAALPDRPCDGELFGEQYLFDETDRIIGWEERLLLSPVALGVDEVGTLVEELGGCIIPAHVDRSYSLINQLGFVPPYLKIPFVEVSRRGKQPHASRMFTAITNSDAHTLADLAGSKPWPLPVESVTIHSVISSLLARCSTET
jgi:3',5'-nucleoside bisphosphate phosphatase